MRAIDYYIELLSLIDDSIKLWEAHCRAIEEQLQKVGSRKSRWFLLLEEKQIARQKIEELMRRRDKCIKSIENLTEQSDFLELDC